MSYLNSYKQDTLVSGTNIKTINGSSILGSGNLVVTGSGASWGSITGTLSSQTDLQTELNNKVPTTRTLTINGSTQDLSANRTFTIANPEGWTVIVKSANQDVTNSGATDDTELQFSIVAGGTYMVDITLAYSGNNTTGDYAFSFGITAGALTGRITYQSITTAGAAFNGTSAAVTSSFFVGVASADLTVVENARILATFRASANATFKMQIGQASPSAARTSRAWKGSILRYKRLD